VALSKCSRLALIFYSVSLRTQPLVCHEVTHVAILAGGVSISSKRQETPLIVWVGMDEALMLRCEIKCRTGDCPRKDGEWRTEDKTAFTD